jgi:hypothetical protein
MRPSSLHILFGVLPPLQRILEAMFCGDSGEVSGNVAVTELA